MKLVLEIEFLTGVCRAARGPGDDSPDWPPQPDRVFSALVSAWAIRGEISEERAALEWLESQPSPVIRASGYVSRTAPEVYVPPNDFRHSTKSDIYIKILPGHRPLQPRRFPVARPNDPRMEIVWPKAPSGEVLNLLNALARCVPYIGHSASLIRCRFLVGDTGKSEHKPTPAHRRIYSGRLNELEDAFYANPDRPSIRPGAPVVPLQPPIPETSGDWLVLDIVEGDVPDIRASALICRLLRRTLMSGYRKTGLKEAIPEIVSGHISDGTPTRQPHLAVAPMSWVGMRHADGRVLGFAFIPPRGESLLGIEGFRAAFEHVTDYRADDQRRILKLQGSPLTTPLILTPASNNSDGKWSLRPNPYLKQSNRWASVTPIVLERHLKRNDESEVQNLVAYACENAGLPRPNPERVGVFKHSTIDGVPPARPSIGEPPWTRWKLPKSLVSRQLVHAVIDFEEEVRGPVLLGAGRFNGLGLCRALKR